MLSKIFLMAKRLESLGYVGDGDFSSFTEDAFKELSHFKTDKDLAELENDLSFWMVSSKIPKQVNVYDGFGQPAVTLFNNDAFVIDLYFWLDIDTSVHSHSFNGAFKVLFGQSLHETFQVEKEKEVASDLFFSKVIRKSALLLKQEDTYAIKSGLRFNHRLIHLETPTVTLCIRTIHDKNISQWHHFTNGLSVEKKEVDQSVLKSLFYFNYLMLRDRPCAESLLDKLMNKWSLSLSLNLYEKVSLGELGLYEESAEYFMQKFLELYQGTSWFQKYHSFFSQIEMSYQEIDDISAQGKLTQHVLNFDYSYKEAIRLLKEVSRGEVSCEYKELLSQLKD